MLNVALPILIWSCLLPFVLGLWLQVSFNVGALDLVAGLFCHFIVGPIRFM